MAEFIRHTSYSFKRQAALSDQELLKLLKLQDFVACTHPVDWRDRHLCITNDDSWIHIADDWYYSLWKKGRYDLVDALHESIPNFPIFACSVGEADSSFDFAYYESGKVVRRYIVEDRHYDKRRRVVVEDIGQRLPLEKALNEMGEEQKYVLSLASGLGVNINHNLEGTRCYVPRLV